MDWLSDNLKKKVIKVFESRYKKRLEDEEVTEIAKNLSDFMEAILRFKLRTEYENKK